MKEYNGRKVIEVRHLEGLHNIKLVIGNYETRREGNDIVMEAGDLRYVVRLKNIGEKRE